MTRRASLFTAAGVAFYGSARLAPLGAEPMPMTAMAGPSDTTMAPGVVIRKYDESAAIIPGYARVQLLDAIMQPGSSTPDSEKGMETPMVCHILEGALRVVQDGTTFTAEKNHVWTCNTGTHERAYNDGASVAVMRMTFLIPK